MAEGVVKKGNFDAARGKKVNSSALSTAILLIGNAPESFSGRFLGIKEVLKKSKSNDLR